METLLLIDIGSTYTKVTAVDADAGTLLGTARAFTTVESDVSVGLQNALDILHRQTGELNYSGRFACSSAAGGLKMVAAGLVPELTAEAAKRAALSAGAKVLKTYSYELSGADIRELETLDPDILLLSGGTDGGNREVILKNARALAGANASFTVVAAGNRSAAEEVEAILRAGGKEVIVCENVMPRFGVLNIEPAREAIRDLFLRRIVRAKGLTEVESLIQGILMPTPAAVLEAVKLLSTGCGGEAGLGELLCIDVGGATTDVYSAADGAPTKAGVLPKGLPEPFAKRTVEGDLGVRYSAPALVDCAGRKAVCDLSGLSQEEMEACLRRMEEDPGVTGGGGIEALDKALASLAVKLAVDRHAGYVETSYSPFGAVTTQTGKDLTELPTVIGTGGPLVHSPAGGDILRHALWSETAPNILKPKAPHLLVDKRYILAAMGLLAQSRPETALKILKRELVPITD